MYPKRLTQCALHHNTPDQAGVSTPEQIREFVQKAGKHLIVIDARNHDFNLEPGTPSAETAAKLLLLLI